MLGRTSLGAIWFLGLAVLEVCRAASGPALIVNDPSGIPAVTTNLSTHLTSAGYTVTTNVGVPAGSLASYKQIWDVRFQNATPLTASDITAYVAYMAGGGSLFVMGENTGFTTRDTSIVNLVTAAGGGTISITAPVFVNGNQVIETVQSPFTGPNPITTVTYLASASSPTHANGAYISKGANVGSALVFGPGNMTNAAAGSLLIVFDVNFLDSDSGNGADPSTAIGVTAQSFTDNLIAYLAAPVVISPPPSAVPTLSEWGMILLACGLTFVAARKLRVPAMANPQ